MVVDGDKQAAGLFVFTLMLCMLRMPRQLVQTLLLLLVLELQGHTDVEM